MNVTKVHNIAPLGWDCSAVSQSLLNIFLFCLWSQITGKTDSDEPCCHLLYCHVIMYRCNKEINRYCCIGVTWYNGPVKQVQEAIVGVKTLNQKGSSHRKLRMAFSLKCPKLLKISNYLAHVFKVSCVTRAKKLRFHFSFSSITFLSSRFSVKSFFFYKAPEATSFNRTAVNK